MSITDEERLLAKTIRALMDYYGPIMMIRAVTEETDRVIEEMATAGYIKEAKIIAFNLDHGNNRGR